MLQDLLKKMNYKGQTPVVVLNAPEGFAEKLMLTLPDAQVTTIADDVEASGFMLTFATQQEQVNRFSVQMAEKLDGDGQLWIAYPKGSSKKYKCDFNRDNGWEKLGELGFEPVRMVAVDEDWSALRFRRVQHIQKLTRSFAISEAGKARTTK